VNFLAAVSQIWKLPKSISWYYKYAIESNQMKLSKVIKRQELFDKVLKTFKLTQDDNVTTFTRADGVSALETIAALRQELIENFPATNALKCKKGVHNGKDAITVLRQLVRFYNKRVVSYRLKVPGTRGRMHRYEYKLAV